MFSGFAHKRKSHVYSIFVVKPVLTVNSHCICGSSGYDSNKIKYINNGVQYLGKIGNIKIDCLGFVDDLVLPEGSLEDSIKQVFFI